MPTHRPPLPFHPNSALHTPVFSLPRALPAIATLSFSCFSSLSWSPPPTQLAFHPLKPPSVYPH